MMFYALVDHNDNGTVFHGVFGTLYHANKAIANYYEEFLELFIMQTKQL